MRDETMVQGYNRRLSLLLLVVLIILSSYVAGECSNACSGHGKCTQYDMCFCNRNWQANDCSERVCMYGLAHVDTPKGDLDMSGDVTGPSVSVIHNSATFPYGTTEQFPQMEDADMHVLTQSAHFYMECSNKGICDRKSGTCDCFDGYDGVACQRASCPGWPLSTCSGHGRCLTASQMAAEDYQNTYMLWDKDSTMGCKCDAGYYGPQCSQRRCKFGIDPLYLDDSATIKYSIFDLATLTTAPGYSAVFDRMPFFTSDGVLFNDGTPQGQPGNFAIKFYDSMGEDWITRPINAGASCQDVVSALEGLPNNVIPEGMTLCSRSYNAAETPDNAWTQSGAREATVQFTSGVNVMLSVVFAAHTVGTSTDLVIESVTSGTGVLDGMIVTSAHIVGGPVYIRGPVTYDANYRPNGCSLSTALAIPLGETMTAVFPFPYPSKTLQVVATASGAINVGTYLRGTGVPAGTYVTDISGLSGGVGSVVLNQPVLIAHPETMIGYSTDNGAEFVASLMSGSNTLVVNSIATGKIVLGMSITGLGLAAGTTISGYATAVLQTTLTVTADSVNVAQLQLSSVAGLYIGQSVIGPGVPDGVYITAVLARSPTIRVSNLVTVLTGATGITADGISPGTAGGVGVYTLSPCATCQLGAALVDVYMQPFEAFSGSAPEAIFDGSHPPTSKHPYKITYRMSVWDSYAALGAQDIGEGGLYTPLAWSPGSFPKATAPGFNLPIVARVHTTVAAPGSNSVAVEPAGAVRLFTTSSASAGDTTIQINSPSTLSSSCVLFGHPSLGFQGSGTTFSPAIKAGSNTLTLDAPLTAALGSGVQLLALPIHAEVAKVSTTLGSSTIKLGGLIEYAIGNGVADNGAVVFTASANSVIMTIAKLYVGVLANGMTVTGCVASGTAVIESGCDTFSVTLTAGTGSQYTEDRLIIAFGTAQNGQVITGPGITDLVYLSGCTGSPPTTCDMVYSDGYPYYTIVPTGSTIIAQGVGTCTLATATTIYNPTKLCYAYPAVFTGVTNGLSSTLAIKSVTSGAVVSGMPVSGGAATGVVGITATGVTLTSCTPSATATSDATESTGTTLTIATATTNILADGMIITGSGIIGTVFLSGCSLNAGVGTCTMSTSQTILASTVITGTQVCTLSTPATVSPLGTLYGADARLVSGSSIAPGTIVTSVDTMLGTITLSKPLIGALPALKNLVFTPYPTFAPGMVFTTPLGTTPAAPSVITAVSGPSALGLYTLTFSGPSRKFIAGDTIRSLQAGENIRETTRQTMSGYIYRLKFFGNPGKLRQPEIVTHLDGKRNSLMSVNFWAGDYSSGVAGMAAGESHYTVITKVWTDGQQGENVDYISDHCDNVQVQIGNFGVSLDGQTISQNTVAYGVEKNTNAAAKFFLTNFNPEKKARLKKCLGSSDFDETNNKDLYNWDHGIDYTTGAIIFPHLIKLVRSVTTYNDGGYYAALYYSELENLDNMAAGGTFFLLNPFSPPDAFATDRYDVYTTKGTLAMTAKAATAVFGFGTRTIYTVTNSGVVPVGGPGVPQPYGSYDGDVSCVHTLKNGAKFQYINVAAVKTLTTTSNITICLDKTDLVTFLNTGYSSSGLNPPHLNLYTVTKLKKAQPAWSNYARYETQGAASASRYDGANMTFMTNEVHLDLSTNWGSSVGSSLSVGFGSQAGFPEGIDTLFNSTIASGFNLFKFFPHEESNYEYVAECSNRGGCNEDEGVCSCFLGYTGDDCHQQTTLAL